MARHPVTAERTPVGSVRCRVDATVAAWRGCDPAALDWPRLLLGALQHRVEGLCLDALRALGWHHQAPPTVVEVLDRHTLHAEARFLAHYRALAELHDLDAELAAALVVVNGMAVVGDYESTGHRLVGDVDLVVDVEQADRVADRARALGYWEKLGPTGPTYFRDDVGLDVHYVPPALWGRENARTWWDHLEPYTLGDLQLCRPRRPLAQLDRLVRLHRRAASWARWTRDDAVRLIHLLDIELDGDVDASAVLALARELRLLPELAVGLAVLAQVRGELPGHLDPLGPYARAVAPCTDLIALPGGDVLRAPEPLAARALALDASRGVRALARHRPDEAYSWRHGYADERTGPPRAVVSRATELLADAGLVAA